MRSMPRKGRAEAKTRSQQTGPGINLAESPIAWLARRRGKDGQPMISEEELSAGERLRADFWFAQMTPRVTANWDATASTASGRRGAPGTGSDVQVNVIAAAERVRRALAAVGPGAYRQVAQAMWRAKSENLEGKSDAQTTNARGPGPRAFNRGIRAQC